MKPKGPNQMHVFPASHTESLSQDPEVRGLLAQSQPGSVTFHTLDSMIYAQGDKAGPLYLVEFGTVRICRLTADGRRQITSFCTAGDVFGLEEGDEHQSYAESVDGVGVRSLRAVNSAAFAQKLLSLALRRLARAQRHALLLGRLNANEKMAAFLLDLLERQESDDIVNLPMQRNDIADYLGLTFETVSRVLRVLKDRRIIRLLSVDRIEVIDIAALTALGDANKLVAFAIRAANRLADGPLGFSLLSRGSQPWSPLLPSKRHAQSRLGRQAPRFRLPARS